MLVLDAFNEQGSAEGKKDHPVQRMEAPSIVQEKPK